MSPRFFMNQALYDKYIQAGYCATMVQVVSDIAYNEVPVITGYTYEEVYLDEQAITVSTPQYTLRVSAIARAVGTTASHLER